jgi:hypothetical protein
LTRRPVGQSQCHAATGSVRAPDFLPLNMDARPCVTARASSGNEPQFVDDWDDGAITFLVAGDVAREPRRESSGTFASDGAAACARSGCCRIPMPTCRVVRPRLYTAARWIVPVQADLLSAGTQPGPRTTAAQRSQCHAAAASTRGMRVALPPPVCCCRTVVRSLLRLAPSDSSGPPPRPIAAPGGHGAFRGSAQRTPRASPPPHGDVTVRLWRARRSQIACDDH